ncbi:MAG: tetratricopeptide repeat protein [Kiloniellales bacterium]|nr:tetratricopeptide repeat protein [Kiloniellales bacterium]
MTKRSCWPAVVSMLMAVLIWSGALADDFAEGLAAYDRGDYGGAMALWLPLARAGNVDAQNNLGWMYEHGQGVDADPAKALYWYGQAAKASPLGEKNLERLRAAAQAQPDPAMEAAPGDHAAPASAVTGSGAAPRDPAEEAFREGLAAFNAGDFRQARATWEDAAAQGHGEAQANLAWLYETGLGGERDPDRSAQLYRQAGKEVPNSQEAVPRPAARPPRPQPAGAQARVPIGDPPQDVTKPGGSGFDDGLAAYDRGDHAEAYRIWLALAERGVPDAQNNLGWLLENGQGADRDLEEALRWYRLAAGSDPRWQENVERVERALARASPSAGRPGDQAPLGTKEAPGPGLYTTLFQRAMSAFEGRDYATAQPLFERLAQAGFIKAQTNLGFLYANGLGVERDDGLARYWYLTAARQGEVYAQNNLATMLASGLGGEIDFVEAYKWYSLSAAEGHAEAAANKSALEALMKPDEVAQAEGRIRAFRRGAE